jgi:maltose alpha-D-glucosyltransferase / alpha-amylase
VACTLLEPCTLRLVPFSGLVFVLLCALVLQKKPTMAGSTALDNKLHWYKDAIIYELHIKAFNDGDDDGVGDFMGLLEKLDYLEELGVTAIWLLPFYPSPLKDDGYDIADYYSINPSYGDIKDLQKLLDEAHKRNLKVITELVINHTSDQHHWFQRARFAPKNSEERNFYVWTDDPSQYKDVRIIFQDFETSNWTWDEVAEQYYWHRFFHHQPDLNYDNPKVQEEVFKMMDFWCNLGVDGFRLDAVPYLFEREGTNGENLPETHAFLKKLRAHIDANYPGTLMLAEANMWPEDSAMYFGNGDECHMNYHFPVMPRMFMAVQMEDRYPITDIFDQTPPIPQTCQWAMFLRNHDELTLEMVTDEERDYMYKVYVKDSKARINLGIRHRLAPLMENDRRKIELMNCLLFSMPGTPVIYYGDEIGMGDNFHLGDRNGVRTPMQWSPDRNAGFSRANPQQLYLPVILDPQYNYEAVNVETQRRNTSSLFWFMKLLIGTRKKYKAFGRGDMKFINVDNSKILAFTRTYEEEAVLIVVNLSKFSQPVEIDLSEYNGAIPVEIFSKNNFPAIKPGVPYFLTLGPHSFQWFKLEKQEQEMVKKEELPVLSISKWDELIVDDVVREKLINEIIPAYFIKTNWFSGKHRPIYQCRIIEHINITLGDNQSTLLLLEVNYKSGLPETYLMPLTFAKEEAAENLMQESPQAVIAKIQLERQTGILCDAFYTSPLQQWIFEKIAANEVISFQHFSLQFSGSEKLKKYLREKSEIRSRIYISRYQNHTMIIYDNDFLLKVYRKVDIGINPDQEISQYLTQAKFPHTPEYLGSLEWKFKKESYPLGTMQQMVESHGNGYDYMSDRVNNFIERIIAEKDFLKRNSCNPPSILQASKFETLAPELQDLLGARASDQSRLIGKRVGQLHMVLAAPKASKDFASENFSLHYQRSLYSAWVGLVRESLQNLHRYEDKLPESEGPEIEKLLRSRNEMLAMFKKIYSKKLDVVKSRIHGSLGLGQILMTGKDVIIHDFEGYAIRSYSEIRLKRSAISDVASMIRTFYYASYTGFLSTNHIPKEELRNWLCYADLWIHFQSSFFLGGWLDVVKGSNLVPSTTEDFEMMIQNYLLDKALRALNFEITNRPEKVIVPLTMARDLLKF